MDNYDSMVIREARTADIPQIQIVRNAVTENTLSDPGLISDEDCFRYLYVRGKGWIVELDGLVVGFSIVDLKDHNIWALFMHPEFEKRGLGRQLHDKMLDWYFNQKETTIWLGTSPNTRAEGFYRKAGWVEVGNHGPDEIKFEMTFSDWSSRHHAI